MAAKEWIDLAQIDPKLVANLARNVLQTHDQPFDSQRRIYEATSSAIEKMNDSNAKLAETLEPLELAARDWANVEQLPVQVQVRCLPCKASASIIVSKVTGTNIYDITVPDGWTLVQEPPRPFSVFLVCPVCRPRYQDLMPKTVERPVQ
jgi:hypothetical protein